MPQLGFRTVLSLGLTLILASYSYADDYNWTGAGTPDLDWSNPDNWVDNEVPPSGDNADVIFDSTGQAASGITMVLDSSWSIGSLVSSEFGPNVAGIIEYRHALDLATNTLTFQGGPWDVMDGDNVSGGSAGDLNFTVSNGDIRGTLSRLSVGSHSSSITSTLHSRGSLDLSSASTILEIGTLAVGDGASGIGVLTFNNETEITVTGNVYLGRRGGNGTLVFGNDSQFTVGEATSRNDFYVAGFRGTGSSSFTMGAGSSFTAYIDDFVVGGGDNTTNASGEFLLSGVNNAILDANSMEIGVNRMGIVELGDNATIRAHNFFQLGRHREEARITTGEGATLEIGSATTPATFRLGFKEISNAGEGVFSVTVGENSTHALYLNNAIIGDRAIDNDNNAGNIAHLNLSESQGIIQLHGETKIGTGRGRIDAQLLSGENTELILGNGSVDPGSLLMGVASTIDAEVGRQRDSLIQLGSNSTLVGHLTSLEMATKIGNPDDSGDISATLDLSNLSSGSLELGSLLMSQGRNVTANLSLANTHVTAETVTVGSDHVNNSATISLNGGSLTVTDNLLLTGQDATLTNSLTLTVRQQNGGLILTDLTTTLDVDNATLSIIFEDPEIPFAGHYTGIRWAGDHVAALNSLASTNRLIWDDTTYLSPEYQGLAEILYLASDNETILGFSVIPEPALLSSLLLAPFLLLRKRK